MMSKIAWLPALLLTGFTAAAQDGHRLVIYSEDSTRFTVSVDEMTEDEQPAARVAVTDIMEDRPEVAIQFADGAIPPVAATRLKLGDPRAANNPAYEVVYALRKSGRKYRLQLVRRTLLPAGGHGVIVKEDASGTSVEIRNPGNINFRTRR